MACELRIITARLLDGALRGFAVHEPLDGVTERVVEA